MMDLASLVVGGIVGVVVGVLIPFGFVPLIEWARTSYFKLRNKEG